MANILDIRRRIRSVINTRQITKAMKMVSAAKLRRAQERALAARPYAQMLTNVLKSLVARAEIYDPETGEPKHPLLAQRPEEKHSADRGDRRQRPGRRFQREYHESCCPVLGFKSAARTSISRRSDARAAISCGAGIPRPKCRRRVWRIWRNRSRRSRNWENEPERFRSRVSTLAFWAKLNLRRPPRWHETSLRRYKREEIDAVYIVFNEFKSVIAQRLIVEQILPIEQIGEQAVRLAEEPTEEEKKKAKEAAVSAGVGMRATEGARAKPERSSAPRRWTTFTSRRPRTCSARCCRSMSAFRFSARCWSPWPPNTPLA